MPSLLVATDFSAAGNGAVHYACRLAADLQYSVTVLHSYVVPVAFSETPMPLVPVRDMQEISESHLEELAGQLQSRYPEVPIEKRLAYGDILDCLQEEAERVRPALVVLGNNGAGQSDGWLGSTAVSVLRNLNTTVLAIPDGAGYNGIRNICLACDFKDIDERMPVAPLLQWVQITGARLHVLHVSREAAADQELRYEDTHLPRLLEGCDVAYHYATAPGSVDERITGFAAEQHMDWLTLIPHHHGFWESLFHKSHTRAMARMSPVPVLALHQ